MWWRKNRGPVDTNIDPKRKYTAGELDLIADEILRQDSRSEICRECELRGTETGFIKTVEQRDDNGQPIVDGEGNTLFVNFPEIRCENGHVWFQGEGQARGIGGENPILFEEHIQSRKRREIHTIAGTPDPSIVAGLYNRQHPSGRKVNSEEQRRKHGASYFR